MVRSILLSSAQRLLLPKIIRSLSVNFVFLSTEESNPKSLNKTLKMGDNNKEKQDDGEVLMLQASKGLYPFYMKQPTEKMNRLFKKYEALLMKQLGDDVVGVYPMGSGAIPGMVGSPMIDILLVMKNSPPTEEQLEKLKELNIGLIGDGNSPHDKDDTWFQNLAFPTQDNFDEYKVNGEHPPDGYLGRLVMHFSPYHSEWVRTVLCFVQYLSQDEGAFKRYRDVKVEEAEIQSKAEKDESGKSTAFFKYKMHKNDVAKQLLDESKEWMEAGNFKLPQELLDYKP